MDSGERQLLDRYFDTTDHSLRAEEWALRFRREQTAPLGAVIRWTRTLKALAPATLEGIAQREERERQVEAPDTHWQGQPLLELFQIHQTRHWWVAQGADLRIEASYDEVRWFKPNIPETPPTPLGGPAHIVELELQQGEASTLHAFAEKFSHITGWPPSPSSKFAHGLSILTE